MACYVNITFLAFVLHLASACVQTSPASSREPAPILAETPPEALAETKSGTPVAPPSSKVEPGRDWRRVHPEDLVLIDTVHGRIAIELNPDFAPRHAERFRQLARTGTYDGAYFYRVINGFVAQGGLKDETAMADWPTLVNENDRARSFATFIPLGNGDLFTRDVGHGEQAFAMARDEVMGREWLLHCPGAVAMARDEDPDSGATEFYIVLDAQRYLDRNLTIFGRVIDGFQFVQKLERGAREVENGVIQAPRTGDAMLSVRLAGDLPIAEQPTYEVMRTEGAAFEQAKQEKRVRADAFFYRKPPEILDICGFDPPVRRTGAR